MMLVRVALLFSVFMVDILNHSRDKFKDTEKQKTKAKYIKKANKCK